jgi:hypothetical protein
MSCHFLYFPTKLAFVFGGTICGLLPAQHDLVAFVDRYLLQPTGVFGVISVIKSAKRTRSETLRKPQSYRTSLRHCRSLFPGNGILRGRDSGVEKALTFNRSLAETKPPHENPQIRRFLHDAGKSFCVGLLRGLELPTKRLSAASPELGSRNSKFLLFSIRCHL